MTRNTLLLVLNGGLSILLLTAIIILALEIQGLGKRVDQTAYEAQRLEYADNQRSQAIKDLEGTLQDVDWRLLDIEYKLKIR
jgi:hypothetical protein